MSRFGRLRFHALCVFFLSLSVGLAAEIIFTEKGDLLIGTITKTEEGWSTFQSSGGEIKLKSSQIIRSESSLDALSDLVVQVELKDGSVLHGTISDFDSEIGLFLDIAFGVLTIPNASVESITDPKQVKRYSGSPYQAKLGASYYIPVGSLVADFSPSFRIEGMGAYAVPGVRGLSAGVDLACNFADFSPVAGVDYLFISLEPLVSYRLLDFRTKSSWVRMLTPFAELGFGPVYVNVRDPQGVPENQGEISPGAFAKAGCDFTVYKELALRAQLRFDAYFQESQPFMAFSFGILGGL